MLLYGLKVCASVSFQSCFLGLQGLELVQAQCLEHQLTRVDTLCLLASLLGLRPVLRSGEGKVLVRTPRSLKAALFAFADKSAVVLDIPLS